MKKPSAVCLQCSTSLPAEPRFDAKADAVAAAKAEARADSNAALEQTSLGRETGQGLLAFAAGFSPFLFKASNAKTNTETD